MCVIASQGRLDCYLLFVIGSLSIVKAGSPGSGSLGATMGSRGAASSSSTTTTTTTTTTVDFRIFIVFLGA